jgi:fusion and transport protein UGO1
MSDKLRPYYDPDSFNAGYSVVFKPGVGLIDTASNKPLTASLTLALAAKKSFHAANGIGLGGFGGTSGGLAPAADKNYVYDLDIDEYLDANNVVELLRNLVWSFVKNYCKVIVAQPLEVVRLVLQVGRFDALDAAPAPPYTRLLDGDSDDDAGFFEPAAKPRARALPRLRASLRASLALPRLRASLALPRRQAHRHQIDPISKHTADIMLAVVAKDGPFALFRGLNAAFIHQTLLHTIEAWITGFVSPFLGIPDPFFLDLTHLTDPWRSLWLLVGACVLTGLVLMPLDLIKIRLMITQFNQPLALSPHPEDVPNVRSIRESIRHYPPSVLLHPPGTITCLTVLYQFLATIFRKAAPYILFIKFNVDAYLAPTVYTVVNLLLLILEFFVKLPVENLLRKEQVRFLLRPKEDDRHHVVTTTPSDMIVAFNDWLADAASWPARVVGLFDGWRVGVLNVVGFWGYNIINSNAIDLREERL